MSPKVLFGLIQSNSIYSVHIGPIQSTFLFGPFCRLWSILVLLFFLITDPLQSYSVRFVHFGSIRYYSVHIALIRSSLSTSVLFRLVWFYSVHFVHFGLIQSFGAYLIQCSLVQSILSPSIQFGHLLLIQSTLFLFGPILSIWSNSVHLDHFGSVWSTSIYFCTLT